MNKPLFVFDNDFANQEALLWSDRSRPFFGAPLSFTKYSLYETRLAVKSGILTVQHEELRLYRIVDVQVRQTVFQRLFGVGSVFLYSSDASSSRKFPIRDIREPQEVARLISDRAEEERRAIGIAAMECFDHYR